MNLSPEIEIDDAAQPRHPAIAEGMAGYMEHVNWVLDMVHLPTPGRIF